MTRLIGLFLAICGFQIVEMSSAIAVTDALVIAAKAEGRVVWYTTQQIDPLARPVAAAFEKKYAIKVDFLRTDSNEVALRILKEGQAGRMQSDVFDGTAGVASLKKLGYVERWLPDTARDLPSEFVDPEGYWAATNIFVITAGINTDLVPPGSEPRKFADLLAPRWKNQMLWSSAPSASAAPGFVGLVLDELGEDAGKVYLRELARQNVSAIKASARQVLDQIVAGEYAIGLQIFNHATVLSASKGAPVRWIDLSPSLVNYNVISLTQGAPHPNAGKLFMDFALSREGQAIYSKGAVLTVHPDIAPFDATLRPNGTTFRARLYTPEVLESRLPGWSKIYSGIFE